MPESNIAALSTPCGRGLREGRYRRGLGASHQRYRLLGQFRRLGGVRSNRGLGVEAVGTKP
jgi:hypothetical protein